MYNFTFELDSTAKKPLYEQLYEHIADEICSRRLDENEKMPSKRTLAAHLGISVNTVETAYELLAQEGHLEPRARSGFYVRHIGAPIKRAAFADEPREERDEEYIADFKTNAVDVKSFPSATWAKLSKEVMYNNPELLGAGNGRGDYELRKNIAKYLIEFRGVNCSPEQIVVGAGIEYLLMIITELLGKGRVYAIENPGYGKINTVLKNSGSSVRYIELDKSGISIGRLRGSDADAVYITPSHQFPTGIVMPAKRRAELLEWASEAEGRYIIEDDYNSEFNFSKKPLTAVQGISGSGSVIYLNTFSRALAPSIRIAYMVLPPGLMAVYEEKFGGYSSTVPRFEQRALSRFISEGYLSRHLNRVKKIYKKRRDAIVEAFEKSPYNISVSGDKAGLHIIAEGADARRVLRKAQENGIKLYSIDECYFCELERKPAIMAGYAGVDGEAIDLLAKILRGI